MRMQRQESSQGPSERYTMDPEAQEEIHQVSLITYFVFMFHFIEVREAVN